MYDLRFVFLLLATSACHTHVLPASKHVDVDYDVIAAGGGPTELALALPPSKYADVDYDVIIVGGGPSGLSALSGLARVRRKAIMLDSGEYRNGQTRHIHDVIGNDGTVPAAFRYLAREQILQYQTASMLNATISSIVKSNNGSYFIATDSTGRVYSGRKVVIATGMKDVLPTTPGVAEAWGKGLFWCPWCDGFEHRDQPFGIIGPINNLLDSIYEIHNLNRDVIAFVNGTLNDNSVKEIEEKENIPDWRKLIAEYGIVLENRILESITRLQDGAIVNSPAQHAEYDQFLVKFTDGNTVRRSAFVANFPAVQRSSLGQDLGVALGPDGHLQVDANGMMSRIDGVYVVGDANNDNSTNVPHAMWSGKRAAVSIHVQIEKEDMPSLSKRDSGSELAAETEQLMGRDIEEIWADLASSP